MLRTLLNLARFLFFALLIICIFYFHLSNSQTLGLNFVLFKFETNVTSIILISLIIGYLLANISNILVRTSGTISKSSKGHHVHNVEKVKTFKTIFKESKEDEDTGRHANYTRPRF